MSWPRTARVLSVVLVFAAALIASSPASATFRGRNGKLLFTRQGALFVMDSDGGDVRRLTRLHDGARTGSFSADGRKIAFSAGKLSDIWLMDANGRHERRLTHPHHHLSNGRTRWDSEPAFSPDGHTLLFARTTRTPEGDSLVDSAVIFAMDRQGRHIRRVRAGQSPSFSPDGRTIAFEGCVGGDCGIAVMDRDGAHSDVIVRNPPGVGPDGLPFSFAVEPRFSPSGRRMTYMVEGTGGGPCDTYMVVADVDGSHRRQLAGDHYCDASPFFSPDGHEIVFTRVELQWPTRIKLMGARGRHARRFAGSEPRTGYALDWQPLP